MATPHTANQIAVEGAQLRVEIAAVEAQIAAAKAQFEQQLGELKAALALKATALLELEPGRYGSDERHLVTVVGQVASGRSADTFELRSKDDEERARELAGEDFAKLFDRHVYFTPKDDFRGLALGLLPKRKATPLIELCLIPGVLTGGKAAHLRWA